MSWVNIFHTLQAAFIIPVSQPLLISYYGAVHIHLISAAPSHSPLKLYFWIIRFPDGTYFSSLPDAFLQYTAWVVTHREALLSVQHFQKVCVNVIALDRLLSKKHLLGVILFINSQLSDISACASLEILPGGPESSIREVLLISRPSILFCIMYKV